METTSGLWLSFRDKEREFPDWLEFAWIIFFVHMLSLCGFDRSTSPKLATLY
jgi:hypothetical protein